MKQTNRSISALRDLIWDNIEKVQRREIDLDRAAIIVKAADTIVASFKVELAHAALFKKPIAELENNHGREEKHENAGGEETGAQGGYQTLAGKESGEGQGAQEAAV